MNNFVRQTKLDLFPYYLKADYAIDGSQQPKDTVDYKVAQDGMRELQTDKSIGMNGQHVVHSLRLVGKTKVKGMASLL